MRIQIGIEKLPEDYEKLLAKELARFATCTIVKEGEGAVVAAEGDVVQCSAVVVICDKYRFNEAEVHNSG